MNRILIVLFFVANVVVAQDDTCDSPKETFDDFNSITKCTIEPSKKAKGKKSRQLSVRVSAPKKRFLKKRIIKKKKVASGLNTMSTSGVSSISQPAEIAKSTEIEKSVAYKRSNAISNILSLTNTLSKDEVRKAGKFNSVDKIPSFSECKSVKKSKRSDCFNVEMIKHIQKHFKYPSEAVRSSTQGEVWVRFIIDKNGDVKNIKALGPDNAEILNDEAIRVVTKLPKFKPARKDGKRVAVKYGFPINFSLEE